MEKPNESQRTKTNTANQNWGTWEEFVLACAVKRHGFKDWDSVAMEVQTRSSLPQLLTTASNCELKFHDLKRRFNNDDDDNNRNDVVVSENGTLSGDRVNHIPWLEELRKLRVAELRQEVQRRDDSILSLQLEVKRLEEERERNLKEKQAIGEDKPDLEVSAGCRSENNEKEGEQLKRIEPDGSEPAENESGKPVHGDESDRDNQSVNESNSTGSRSENRKTGKVARDVKLEPETVGDDKQEPVCRGDKPPVGEESENENRGVESVQPSEEKKVEDSSELRDSVADGEVGGTKESSEVQSSATLTGKRNRRRRKEVSGGTSGEYQPENDEVSVKSQPLVGVLEMIKGHEHCSLLFERLLENQVLDRFHFRNG